MNAYVLSVVGTVLICCVFLAIIPEGKTGNIIQGVTKWICILIIVAPILSFFQTKKLPELFNKNDESILQENGIQIDASFIKYYSEMRIRKAEQALVEEIQDKFDIKVSIEIVWDFENQQIDGLDGQDICILQICVSGMQEQSKEKKDSVQKYLLENYCKKVLII